MTIDDVKVVSSILCSARGVIDLGGDNVCLLEGINGLGRFSVETEDFDLRSVDRQLTIGIDLLDNSIACRLELQKHHIVLRLPFDILGVNSLELNLMVLPIATIKFYKKRSMYG